MSSRPTPRAATLWGCRPAPPWPIMAVAYSEDIAAAGAVAGLPYGEDACAVAHGFYTGIAHKPWAAFVEAMRAEQQEPEEQRLVPLPPDRPARADPRWRPAGHEETIVEPRRRLLSPPC
jgi:hypothetical protein